MDRAQEIFNYIMTLELDQVQDFVKSLSKEDQLMLVSHTVGALNGLAQHFVQNSEEIWDTKTIEYPEITAPKLRKH